MPLAQARPWSLRWCGDSRVDLTIHRLLSVTSEGLTSQPSSMRTTMDFDHFTATYTQNTRKINCVRNKCSESHMIAFQKASRSGAGTRPRQPSWRGWGEVGARRDGRELLGGPALRLCRQLATKAREPINLPSSLPPPKSGQSAFHSPSCCLAA